MPDHAKLDHPEPHDAPGDKVEREFTVAQRSQAQLVLRRFLRHRLAVTSLIVLLAVVLLAFVGGWLWKYSVVDITPDESEAPSWEHPFGTDAAGKDQFALVLRGTQISIAISVLVALFATVVGTIWGTTAGYYRG
ncbi:MAG: ABC transporter permease, partial [Pseudonocardiaceae bacterium]